MRKFYNTLLTLNLGDRVVVPKSSVRWVQHHAIFLGFQNGFFWFIENKEGHGVRVLTAEKFFSDVIEITRIERFVPKWNYSREDLVNYALSKKGKAYHITNYNCEHFANEIQHRITKSKQVDIGVGLGLLGLSLLVIAAFNTK